MKTLIRSFIVLTSFAYLLFIGFACNKEVICDDEPEPTIQEPVLAAYLDGLEQVLYYAEEYKDQLATDQHILRWTDNKVAYSGYNLLGEPMTAELSAVAVPASDLEELADNLTANFLEQLEFGTVDLIGQLAPSRPHLGMTCGTAKATPKSCDNTSDTTSTRRTYESIRKCEDGLSTDKCTEFYLKWYTEYHFDGIGCIGNITGIKEHGKWQCAQ